MGKIFRHGDVLLSLLNLFAHCILKENPTICADVLQDICKLCIVCSRMGILVS